MSLMFGKFESHIPNTPQWLLDVCDRMSRVYKNSSILMQPPCVFASKHTESTSELCAYLGLGYLPREVLSKAIQNSIDRILKIGAEEMIVCSESWNVEVSEEEFEELKQFPPSKNPNRKDCVILYYLNRKGEYFVACCNTTKDSDGTIKPGEWRVSNESEDRLGIAAKAKQLRRKYLKEKKKKGFDYDSLFGQAGSRFRRN